MLTALTMFRELRYSHLLATSPGRVSRNLMEINMHVCTLESMFIGCEKLHIDTKYVIFTVLI